MELVTIMVVSSAMQEKANCYVKVVEENYYCDMSECTYSKIHLIFLSEWDYIKIKEIEKMCEKYYTLEGVEGDEGEKEKNLYCQLKKIISYLNECEVMEVISDHPDAFDLMFNYIRYIMSKSEDMRPQRRLFKFVSDEKEDEDEDEDEEDEDEDEETLFESMYMPKEYETERLKKTDYKGWKFFVG